jgi:beta-1,4-mannosyl-glycoprotein beta-1,4-N-acetylglucosaminyltransferase
MKIIDAFLLFNEIDLLELRLNMLYDHVDYFVITESDTTFSGNYKDFNFLKNRDRFKKFENKIVYNPISTPPELTITWDREIFQRNASINKIIEIASDDDLILTSDIDEIPSPLVLENYTKWYNKDTHYHFQQNMYMYFLNNYKTSNWFGTRACSFSYLKNRSIDDIRESTENVHDLTGHVLQNAGWHFSYLGGEDQIKYKLESFSHQEFNRNDIKNNINKSLSENTDVLGRSIQYKVVDIDESYPKYLLDNLEKYKHLVK